MAQKVASGRKMKSRQETTSLSQITTVMSDGKANNKQQAFINTNTRGFKIQTGDMGPPPGRASDIGSKWLLDTRNVLDTTRSSIIDEFYQGLCYPPPSPQM